MKSRVVELFEQYPDEKRHPLVIDNPDWDILNDVLGEWFDVASSPVSSAVMSLKILRGIIEIVYVMGYESGSKDG